MGSQTTKFHPVTRICAAFGAVFCLFAAIIAFISAIMQLPNIIEFGLEFSKSVLVLWLAWTFWFAFKNSQSPFTSKLFSK